VPVGRRTSGRCRATCPLRARGAGPSGGNGQRQRGAGTSGVRDDFLFSVPPPAGPAACAVNLGEQALCVLAGLTGKTGAGTLPAWPPLAGKILTTTVPVVAAAVLIWLRRLSPAAPG
jgi:hypothetical protein